ncbi:hypothetical protein V8C44DRAFT_336949 [Trichoderma aethiopicum]
MLCYAMPCHAKPNPVSAEGSRCLSLEPFSVLWRSMPASIIVGRASPAPSSSRPDKCLEWQGQVSNETTPTPSTSASPPGTHRCVTDRRVRAAPHTPCRARSLLCSACPLRPLVSVPILVLAIVQSHGPQ